MSAQGRLLSNESGRTTGTTSLRKAAAKSLFNRLPWNLRQAILLARPYLAYRKPPFSGVYARYEDAPNSNFYDSAAWADAAAISMRANRADPDLPRGTGALLSTVLGTMSGPKSVLDFGGGTGCDFAYLVDRTDNPDLSYTVIDTPAACKVGRAIWSNDKRICFSDAAPEAATFDVVYSAGALMYAADPISLLERFTEYKPRIVLLCRHPFAERAFVRCQVNMAAPIAQWVLSLPEVIGTMKKKGYELRLNVATEDSFNVENFSADTAVGGFRNLMFVRSS